MFAFKDESKFSGIFFRKLPTSGDSKTIIQTDVPLRSLNHKNWTYLPSINAIPSHVKLNRTEDTMLEAQGDLELTLKFHLSKPVKFTFWFTETYLSRLSMVC